MRWSALGIVALHALVILAHDSAHRELPVELSLWQTIYAYSVIVLAPLVAVALVFTRAARQGFTLLALSMLGALVFGAYHHYVGISPDNVAHLPEGEAQGLFRATAAAMIVIEIAGIGAGVWGRRG